MSFYDADMLDLNIHIDDPEPMYEWLREEEPMFLSLYTHLTLPTTYTV